MLLSRNEIFKWIKKFINNCEKNDIWYVADDMTLLGSYKHGGFVPWYEKFQAMMTVESYNKLKRLFPMNIIDNVKDKNYKSLKPSFVKNANNWTDESPFVEIRIIVPTKINKIKSWKKITNIFWSYLIQKRNTIKNAINDLQDKEFEGFYTITSKFSPSYKNWIYNMSFKTEKIKFHNIDINAPIEYKEILLNWFGKFYMEKKELPKNFYSFPSPTKKNKEKF